MEDVQVNHHPSVYSLSKEFFSGRNTLMRMFLMPFLWRRFQAFHVGKVFSFARVTSLSGLISCSSLSFGHRGTKFEMAHCHVRAHIYISVSSLI